MNWLQRLIAGRFVKGLLDKIPGNGFKTAIGVVLIVLGAVAQMYPQYGSIVNWLIELLQPYANSIQDAGIVALIVGVVHKVAKWIAGRASE